MQKNKNIKAPENQFNPQKPHDVEALCVKDRLFDGKLSKICLATANACKHVNNYLVRRLRSFFSSFSRFQLFCHYVFIYSHLRWQLVSFPIPQVVILDLKIMCFESMAFAGILLILKCRVTAVTDDT